MRALVASKFAPLLLAVFSAMLAMFVVPSATASAAGQDQATDQLQLIDMQAGQLDSTSRNGMRIETKVAYLLGSAQKGYLALFTFEDSATTPSAQSSPIAISAGTGQVTLDIDYEPDPRVQTLNLLIGLFSTDARLIGWLATNPLPMNSLAGRVQFQEAMDARASGDNSRALDFLTQAISLSPKAGILYYWRGDTLLRTGDYDGAIADYDSALELMPGHAASMIGRGVAEVWKQQWQDSIDDLTTALDATGENTPQAAWAYRARGVAFAGLGRDAEAVADYRAYLDLTPDASDRAQVEEWITQLGAS